MVFAFGIFPLCIISFTEVTRLGNFLEAGFDTFAGMSGQGSRGNEFLSMIHVREIYWINQLFTDNPAPCIEQLQATMNHVVKNAA